MRRMAAIAAASAALAAAPRAWAEAPAAVGEVVVVAPAPLPGGETDPDKRPSAVRVLSAGQLQTGARGGLADALAGRSAAIHVSDEQGSTFQPDVEFRGFDASSVLGAEGGEGLAVYQNGVRQNEAFGDLVNWDLSPAFAIDRVALMGADPVFGLNALGGAVSLTMKNGFTAPGGSLELSGGSFGRAEGTLQYGAGKGAFGVYLGVRGVSDQGFRQHSPARLAQAYADLGWRGDRGELHLTLEGADNQLNAVGATPIELLDRSWSAAFTWPQTVRDQLAAVTLSGTWRVSSAVQLASDLYYRRFSQRTADGNTTNVSNAGCANPAYNPGGAFLCLGDPADTLYDRSGAPVPDVLGAQIASGADIAYGELDRSSTATDGFGAALQATWSAHPAGRPNRLVVGAAVDHGLTRYRTASELAKIGPDLGVTGLGYVIDQLAGPQGGEAALAAGEIIAPVDLFAADTYLGIYFSDALDLTSRLTATLSGRYNWAAVDLSDQRATSLNGAHRYGRFNPAIGATYKVGEALTIYADYAESNRNPTAAELACADPARPCVLAGQLVADPELKPVIGRTIEAGLRGRARAAPLAADLVWSLGVFRTDTDNEILNIATRAFSTGQGYFANAGAARRQGLELEAALTAARWRFSLDYSLIDATFRSRLSLPSNSPYADPATGDIAVVPGDRLPLTPAQRLVVNADWSATAKLSLGADLRAQGGEYLAGDASNQAPRLPGWVRLDLRARYQLAPRLQLFARVENLAGARYYAYGVFTGLDGLPPSFALADPRSFTPAAPRAAYVGLNAAF